MIMRVIAGRLPSNGQRRRQGFTLVELLMVITIIGMLAGLSLGALYSARETAREAKTRSTIAKLDVLVQEVYGSYKTRRVVIYKLVGSSQRPVRLTGSDFRNLSSKEGSRLLAEIRLHTLRDVMRMEMPERHSDIVNDPQRIPINGTLYCTERTALSRRFQRYYAPTNDSYVSAECLYMWLTAADPDAAEMFGANEVGDSDEDGYPEFLDGWGNPIRFLRWAPGFVDSDIQPVLRGADIENSEIRREVSLADHDPFDPLMIDINVIPLTANDPNRGGWRLVPLVYSAGPDKIYGINSGGPDHAYTGNPFYSKNSDGSLEVLKIGAPAEKFDENQVPNGPSAGNGLDDSLDNIHNHRLEMRS